MNLERIIERAIDAFVQRQKAGFNTSNLNEEQRFLARDIASAIRKEFPTIETNSIASNLSKIADQLTNKK